MVQEKMKKIMQKPFSDGSYSKGDDLLGDQFVDDDGLLLFNYNKDDSLDGHAKMIEPFLKDLDIIEGDEIMSPQQTVTEFIEKTGMIRTKHIGQTLAFELAHWPTKGQIRGMKLAMSQYSGDMADVHFDVSGDAPSEKQINKMVMGIGWWNIGEAFVEQEHPRDHGKFTKKGSGTGPDKNVPQHNKDFGTGKATKNKESVARQIKDQYPQLDDKFIKTQLDKADELRNDMIKPHKQLCDELQSKFKNVVVAGRIKEADSMVGKLARRPDDYKIVSDLNDVSGIRATAKNIGEIQQVVDYVKEHYDIIQEKDNINEDRGGYRSYHAVVMKDGVKHEFQLRTENQDKWANYAHDNFYKPATRQQADFFSRHKSRINDYTLEMSNYFYAKDMGRNIKEPDCPPVIRLVVDCL
jgi:ppGpp synthetase/RelA/SpoT-type nucleotidyltranferase